MCALGTETNGKKPQATKGHLCVHLTNTMQNKNVCTLHKKWTWRKPKGKPKRPLSAYNIFFADVRQELLTARDDDQGIGFRNLARAVADRWKGLDPASRAPYTEKAKLAKDKYAIELDLWKDSQMLLPDAVFAPTVEVTPSKDYSLPSGLSDDSTHSASIVRYDSRNDLIPDIELVPPSHLTSIATTKTPLRTSYAYNSWTEERPEDIPKCLPRYYDNQSVQAALFQSPTAPSKAWITPSLRSRSVFTMNEPFPHGFNEDSFEPLPLTNTMDNFSELPLTYSQDHFSDMYSLPLEEPKLLNHRISDLRHQTVTDTIGGTNLMNYTGAYGGGMNNVYFSGAHTPVRSQNITDDPSNQCTWNSTHLEKLLRAMESDELDRFFSR